MLALAANEIKFARRKIMHRRSNAPAVHFKLCKHFNRGMRISIAERQISLNKLFVNQIICS